MLLSVIKLVLALWSFDTISSGPASNEQRQFDVIVYGATPAGIAAALAAADAGVKRVALVEPSYQIGGMMTQGGIGMRDYHPHSPLGHANNSIMEWIALNSKYYNVSTPVMQPDNYVGVKHLWKILKRRKGIEIVTNSSIISTSVRKNGTKIVSFATITSHNQKVTKWLASVFIDATYEGDLMVASGCSWTYGRESRDTYNESLGGVTNKSSGQFDVKVSATWNNGSLLPGVDPPSSLRPVGAADKRVMGYSYRLCVTKWKPNQAPFPSPQAGTLNYNPEDFELLRRYYYVMSSMNKTVQMPFGELSYNGYPPGNKFDVCDSGPDTPITTDMANTGKYYPNATWAEREKIILQHKNYVAGMFYFLRTDPSVPEAIAAEIRQLGLCKDEWPENGHWPPQMYVREAGRLVGDIVFSQNDRLPSVNVCRSDSIGVADWYIDIHIMARVAVLDPIRKDFYARNEGQTPFDGPYQTFPFELPYSVLLPKKNEITNLLVPNCPSVSHVVFSSVRVEPTLWKLGQAAGVAASMVVAAGGKAVPVQDIPVHRIQRELLHQGAIIHWPDKFVCP